MEKSCERGDKREGKSREDVIACNKEDYRAPWFASGKTCYVLGPAIIFSQDDTYGRISHSSSTIMSQASYLNPFAIYPLPPPTVCTPSHQPTGGGG